MRNLLMGLVVGAVLMDSWRVAQEVQLSRELARLRAEHTAGRREAAVAEIGEAYVDEDGEVWR